MIIALFILFIALTTGIGYYLLKHRKTGFMGMEPRVIKGVTTFFGWTFMSLGVATAVSALIFGTKPWPTLIFILLASISTALLPMIYAPLLYRK
ncbi:MAG: hypothetical protein LBT80_00180 [Lactobacillaceae bacterium]|jgi:hypothetical protein|nr:hypothetical protein [Lactobacillaceae bacterium]